MSDYPSLLSFKGKNVVITGGVSGAGRQIAEVFLQAKANVIATYYHSEAEALRMKEEHVDDPLTLYQLDLAKTESIQAFCTFLKETFGRIDVLVNNAGIYPARSLDLISEEDWDSMLNINTKGVFFLSRKISKLMEKGSIINISSINATNPAENLIHYGVSKAGVEMLTRCFAQKLGPNIRVNCIAPGLIYKEGQEKFIPGWRESYSERSALHRLVYAEEIGRVALFFASDLSSAVTGETLTVDCGVNLAPYFDNHLK